MITWIILWAVLVVDADGMRGSVIKQNLPKFTSEAQCKDFVAKYEEGAPFYFLGMGDAPLNTEIHTKGACVVDGNPA